MGAETCAECGFDARRWNVHDADSLLSGLGFWWHHVTEGISAGDLGARPEPPEMPGAAGAAALALGRPAVLADLER